MPVEASTAASSLGSAPRAPVYEEAKRFLNILGRGETTHTFQTFDDDKDRVNPRLARILHGTLDEHYEVLRNLNLQGAAICVAVNETNGKGRKIDDITKVRALYQDDDGNGIDLPIKPHIAVETSPGRFHNYWSVNNINLDEYDGIHQQIIDDYGCDPACKGVNKALRMPGFFHCKEEPHLVRIVATNDISPYGREKVMEALKLDKRRKRKKNTSGNPFPEGQRNNTLISIAGSMRAQGRPQEDIEDALLVLNEQRCDPPLTEKEVRAIAKSACRYPPGISYEEAVQEAERFTEEASSEAVYALLDKCRSLDLVSHERLLKLIKKCTRIPLQVLREMAKGGDDQEDLALKVVGIALEQYWSNGEYLINYIDRQFYEYTGTHWQPITDDQVKKKLLEVIKDTIPPGTANYSNVLNASLNLLQAQQAAEGDVLRLTQEPLPVVNCQNGELWIDDDGNVEQRPHRADSYLTNVLDVEYNPDAECPLFDSALDSMFPEDTDEMVRHLEEFIGYAIQPRRNIPAIFMLTGAGNNGKTKLAETMEKLMSKSAILAARVVELERDKFSIGKLAGKLLFMDDDVSDNTKLPDGTLKKISERKLLTGERKNKDPFEFSNTALPVLLANSWPRLTDLTYGIRKRMHPVPFLRTFYHDARDAEAAKEKGERYAAVANPKLFPEIWETEMPGVLNRALAGLKRLLERGRFEQPIPCIEARRKWLAEANPLAQFVQDEDWCEHDADGHWLLGELYGTLKEWAGVQGIQPHHIPQQKTVKRKLVALGYNVVHTNRGNAVRGLRRGRTAPVEF